MNTELQIHFISMVRHSNKIFNRGEVTIRFVIYRFTLDGKKLFSRFKFVIINNNFTVVFHVSHVQELSNSFV